MSQGWNTTWEAAKSASSVSPAWISFIGDSVLAGGNCTDVDASGYYGLIRTYLLTKYSQYADFYSVTQSTANYGSSYPGTPPFVYNVTAGLTFNIHGYNKAPGWSNTPATPSLTFTTPYACTDIDILYFDLTNGLSWSYNVDAGGAVTVNTAEPADQKVKRITLTGLSNSTHSIVFGDQTATNACIILGVATYKSRTTGLGFARFAYPAASANDYINNTVWPTEDRISLFSGVNPQAIPPNTTYTFGFPTQPHLAVIAFGINDCSNSISTTTFSTILQRFITALRNGRSNCSIILVGSCMPNTSHSDVLSGVSNGSNWQNYIDKMKTLAQTNNCAFVNISERWGETPAGKQFMHTNNVHPYEVGHADIAGVLQRII